LPGSGFSGLSTTDRYVPSYLYMLIQLYSEENGDLTAISNDMAAKGINLADLEDYLPNR
jgi:hypothetical protein